MLRNNHLECDNIPMKNCRSATYSLTHKSLGHAKAIVGLPMLVRALAILSLLLSGCMQTSTLLAPVVTSEEPDSNQESTDTISGSDCQTLILGTFPLSPEPALQEALSNAGTLSQTSKLTVTETHFFFLLGSRKCLVVSEKTSKD